MKDRKVRVGVIFGGRSGEHEISLASARSLMAAIDKDKYELIPIGITHDGRWLTSGDPMAALAADARASLSLPAATGGKPEEAEHHREPLARELVPGASGRAIPSLDVIFPVLHGPYGEDGTIQGLFELAGLPYVGCGVLASSAAMDKLASKDIFLAHGLPIVPFRPVQRRTWEARPEEVLDDLETSLQYPVFVKPANLGSSIGVSKASDRAQLSAALMEAARYDRRLVVEEAVPDAREIECSVLGNDDPIASVPGEIIPCNEWYDYAAKYLDDRSELLIPAPIPPAATARVQELAVEAFRALDGAGLARVDFLMDAAGIIYLNEINTMPGFTSISMYPKLWAASGISYSELIDRLIALALERHEDNGRRLTVYGGAMGAS